MEKELKKCTMLPRANLDKALSLVCKQMCVAGVTYNK